MRTTTRPAVYCGTYAKYNSGSIAGAWVCLDDFTDKDEFFNALRALHKDERNPEFMFQDFEGFPDAWYDESGCNWDAIFNWLELDEDDRERVAEYIEEADGSADPWHVSQISYYHQMADDDFGYILAEECGYLNDLPEIAVTYFDFAAFGRDCKLDCKETSNYIFMD